MLPRIVHRRALERTVSVGEVDQRKRHIAKPRRQAGFQSLHHFGARRCGGECGADVAQHAQLTFANDPLGDLSNNTQHAGRGAFVIGERGIGKSMIGLFCEPTAFQIQQQGFVPGRLRR